VLLIFGALVYGLVSVILLDQMDTSLSQSPNGWWLSFRINAAASSTRVPSPACS